MIPYAHSGVLRKLSEYLINRPNDGFALVQGPFGIGKSYIVRQAIKTSFPNIPKQFIFSLNINKIDDFINSFINSMSTLTDKNKFNLFMPSNAMSNISNSYNSKNLSHPSNTAQIEKLGESLIPLFDGLNRLLSELRIKLPVGIRFIKPLDPKLLDIFIKHLPSTNIIPILICDDMASIIYFYNNLISNKSFVLEVQEPEEDFIRKYIKTHITSFNEVIDAILLIAGNNLFLINRIADYLKNSTKSISADYSDEFYPFGGTKDDQNRYELLEGQKAAIQAMADTVFINDIEEINSKMDALETFPSLIKMKEGMNNNIHFKVVIYETIRYILNKPVLQAYNLNYQKNPALIYSDILFYHFSTGKFIVANNLIKRLAIDYINSKYNELTRSEMIEYNLNYLLNFKIIQKEVQLAM